MYFSTTNLSLDKTSLSVKTEKLCQNSKDILNNLPKTPKSQFKETQKYGIYFSIHGNKNISHNSQDIINNMKKLSKLATQRFSNHDYCADFNNAETSILSFFTKIDECGKTFIINSVIDYIDSNIKALKVEADFRWLGSLALGYYIIDNGRFEFEVIYSQEAIHSTSSLDPLNLSGKMSMYAIMPNLYYNPNIKNTSLAPYIGVGAGLMNIRLASNQPECTLLSFPYVAYQVSWV